MKTTHQVTCFVLLYCPIGFILHVDAAGLLFLIYFPSFCSHGRYLSLQYSDHVIDKTKSGKDRTHQIGCFNRLIHSSLLHNPKQAIAKSALSLYHGASTRANQYQASARGRAGRDPMYENSPLVFFLPRNIYPFNEIHNTMEVVVPRDETSTDTLTTDTDLLRSHSIRTPPNQAALH